MVTKAEIERWFEEGLEQGASYMIVVVDTFNWEDYPAFVKPTENIHDRIQYYLRSPMQKIMEVYDLTQDKQMQLNESRTMRFPAWPEPDVQNTR